MNAACDKAKVKSGVWIGIILAILWLMAQTLLHNDTWPGKKVKIRAATAQINVNFATALDAFKAAAGHYPTAAEGLQALAAKSAGQADGRTEPFLPSIPLDPWGNEYRYLCPGVHNADAYDLSSDGPDGKPEGGDDIRNWDTPQDEYRILEGPPSHGR
jgi:general secretion pathway protein G